MEVEENAKREKLLYVLLEMGIFEELDGEGAVSGVAGKGRGLEGGRRYVSCDSCLRWGCGRKCQEREKLLYVLLEMGIFEELDGEEAVSGVAGKGRGLEGGRR
ncbi:hypothetical protein ACFX13_030705 [Malus domestica]